MVKIFDFSQVFFYYIAFILTMARNNFLKFAAIIKTSVALAAPPAYHTNMPTLYFTNKKRRHLPGPLYKIKTEPAKIVSLLPVLW
jgi:hypothetical protein